MSSDLIRLTALPAEIIFLIFDSLTLSELKVIRYVSKEVNDIVRPLLFRSVSVSVLPHDLLKLKLIARDTQLASAVEEIVWNELQFRSIKRNPGERAGILGTCQNQLDWAVLTDKYGEEVFGRPLAESVWNFSQRLNQRYRIMRMWLNIADCRLESRREFCLSIVAEAFSKLARLKRIVSRDGRDGGVQVDSAYQRFIDRDHEGFYPVREGQLRHLLFDQSDISPDLGFWAMLEALSRSAADVHTLVTERTIGLMKRGIPLDHFHDHGPTSKTTKYIASFQKLRYVSLCLDCSGEWNSRTAINLEEESEHYFGTSLHKFLEAATELESLHLSLTGPESYSVLFKDLLGQGSWPKLGTVILESLTFHDLDIIGFVTRHASVLKHLTLWKCAMMTGNSRWSNVIRAMARLKNLTLESLTVKGPRHVKGVPFQAPVLGQPTLDQPEWQYIPEPAEHDLLLYVNDGIGTNPYDLSDNLRRFVDSSDAFSDYSDAVAAVSDYGGDLTETLSQRFNDHDSIDYDFEGPQYCSDWEPSDSEVDGEESSRVKSSTAPIVIDDERDEGISLLGDSESTPIVIE